MFDDIKENTNVLDYSDGTNQVENEEKDKVKDTDYVDQEGDFDELCQKVKRYFI